MVLYAVDEGPGQGMETSCGAGLHSAVYAWAPGLAAFQFVEGGLIAQAGQKYTLELHYNNSAAYTDIRILAVSVYFTHRPVMVLPSICSP